MSPSVLYISYTGLLEPLGQSQVLQYLLALARDYRITLLTFEKPEALAERGGVDALAARCRTAGVDWHYHIYHKRPSIPATVYDLVVGALTGIRLARRAGVQIVHCRSYLASLMGLAVKRATGARHVFDMRGFWPDERVDGGIWARRSIRYRVFKHVERRLFLGTDHVVSLTRAGVREFSAFDYLQGRLPPVSVIPTCTNLELFSPAAPVSESGKGFTLGYVGSAGSWYLFDQVARAVRLLFDDLSDARFLVINKGDHDEIRARLSEAGVDLARVEIKAVPFEQVGQEIARMDAGIFFYKPDWSKRATSPTRLGEFLACGKPCLANAGVGDVEANLTETGAGLVVHSMDDRALRLAIGRLVALSAHQGIAERCRKAAVERFSLKGGVALYAEIYATLSLVHGAGLK